MIYVNDFDNMSLEKQKIKKENSNIFLKFLSK